MQNSFSVVSINSCFSEPRNLFTMVFVSFLVALLVKDFKCPGKRTNDFSGLCLVIKVSVLSCLKQFLNFWR